jgi:hypothetical protein
MANADIGALLRAWALALLVFGIWAFTKYVDALPTPLRVDAPATVFSAGRAEVVLGRLLGPQVPHPASSAENARLRQRILDEYARMGIATTTQQGLGCNLSKGFGALACGTVTNVIAQVNPGRGKALVLLAHFDSVPAGPGASDDQSGDATIFETVRALKARGGMSSAHPIIALHTDGEEFGLLGANAFLDDPANRARVGAVINVEARGNQGQSLLFQTSPGDAKLIELYARSVPRYATSSLFAVIYKLLPNDTDLTVFLNHDLAGYNFAFSDNVAHYHTALDRRENLDPGTLQMHGDNMLGMAATLAHTDFSELSGGGDAVYVTVLDHFLPRMPVAWALPLAILVTVLLLASFWGTNETATGWRGWVSAFAIVPALDIGAVAIGWVLFVVAQLVSGHPDPTYACPLPVRIALAFGVWSVALVVSGFARTRPSALGVWLFIAVLALVNAAFLPGLSPYYLFPALIAAPLVLGQAFLPRAWTGPAAQLLLLFAAIPMLILWIGLSITSEQIEGLSLHPLMTSTLGTAFAALVPVLAAQKLSRTARYGSAGVAFAIALGFAVWGGLVPAYTEMKPQRLDISYEEDAITHRASWAATARPLGLPASLRAVANFSQGTQKLDPSAFFESYVAPAGMPHLPPPTADIRIAKGTLGLRRVTLALKGGDANQMVLVVPQEARMKAIEIGGKRFDAPPTWESLPRQIIACSTDDCANKEITLELGAKKPVEIILLSQRYGIPSGGAKLQAARPKTAVISQNGDTTILINRVKIPGP